MQASEFWSKVDKGSECWTWTGTHDHYGYGVVYTGHGRRGRKQIKAHRLAFALANSIPLPDRTVEVCHSCDNPSCVRPEHLWAGSHTENMQDQFSKRRHAFGEKNGHAILTEDAVREIRRRCANGERGVSLAREYGVCHSTITAIKNGRNWRHVV